MCFFHRHHAGFKKDGSEKSTFQRSCDKRYLTFDRSEIEELIGEQEIDVLIGGPPCKGFTNMGDKLGDDPRNHLVDAYLRFVRWTTPKMILMENVP